MDPYLEARWSDVHVTLLAQVKEALQPSLPRDLRARSEERVLLETTEDEEALRQYRADVAIVELPRDSGHWAGGAGIAAGATVEPVMIEIVPAPELERFIHIIDLSSGNRVVTVIEIMSPWYKGAGKLNQKYRKKLNDYADADVNVVEIDLLRSSRGRLAFGQEDLPIHRREPYLAAIHRAKDPDRWAVYPISLRHPLPKIPIPLRPTDQEILLDLQPLIERVYVAGGHDDIDYSKPPNPPLEGPDAEWADQLLREAGLRKG